VEVRLDHGAAGDLQEPLASFNIEGGRELNALDLLGGGPGDGR